MSRVDIPTILCRFKQDTSHLFVLPEVSGNGWLVQKAPASRPLARFGAEDGSGLIPGDVIEKLIFKLGIHETLF